MSTLSEEVETPYLSFIVHYLGIARFDTKTMSIPAEKLLYSMLSSSRGNVKTFSNSEDDTRYFSSFDASYIYSILGSPMALGWI